MKGDMWDDGTPNLLIVTCPICGGIDITAAIGTGTVRYHCNGCNYTWFLQKQEITTSGPLQYAPPSVTAPSYSITTPYNGGTECVMDNYNAWLTGWMCPKCGRIYSPATTECEHCNHEGGANSNSSNK